MIDYKVPLWAHQHKAISQFLESNQHDYALFMDPGTGKTATAINIIRHLCEKYLCVQRTLIISPIITLENWKKEWERHSKIRPEQIQILYGSQVKRIEKLELFSDTAKVFITNYESLLMGNLMKEIHKWKPEILVYDESHKLKSYGSKRSKAAWELSRVLSLKHRFLLSGTPVLNSPMDLWSQYLCMDKGKTFGHNFFQFRATYFFDRNAAMPRARYFPDWVPRNTTYAELNRKIGKTSFRAKKEDCLTLPPLIRQVISVELTSVQRRTYDDIKKRLVAYMGSKECVTTLALTKALRLMQICSGHVGVTDSEDKESSTHVFDENPKADALSELLEEITPGHKVIVWAVWRADYSAIRAVCDKLRIKYTEIHGDVDGPKKFENMDQFNSDVETRVLIGNPRSGGVGVNLVAASYAIFFSKNFSLEDDLQAIARCYRAGSEQHKKITRIDLIAKNTIDEQVTEALERKEDIGEKLLASFRPSDY